MFIHYRGLYKVRDSDLRLHPDPDGRRILSTKARFFLVASRQDVCASSAWKYVLGCPTSTDSAHMTDLDLELPKGSCNNPQRCWVRIPALQPLDKSVLLRGDFVGELKGDLRRDFEILIAEAVGLIY